MSRYFLNGYSPWLWAAVGTGVLGGLVGGYLERAGMREGHRWVTLTATVRYAAGIDPRKPWSNFGTSMLVFGASWLVLHFARPTHAAVEAIEEQA